MAGSGAEWTSGAAGAKRAVFLTLGCKLNQTESEGLASKFRGDGFLVSDCLDESAQIVVINTCTVTSKAEQKARGLIRRALKIASGAKIVVTGCAAASLKGSLVLSGGDAGRVVFDENLKTRWGQVEKFNFHSRAFLKIQDGCDNHCSFCAVRLARGGSVSLGAGEVLRRLRLLEAGGVNEAVLTGVNISQYRDAEGGIAGLGALVDFLLRGTERIALRLSSLEPAGGGEGAYAPLFDEAFFEAVKNPRVRAHFHLSVQSASAAVLSRMGRFYVKDDLFALIKRLREVKDEPFLACDIITGFPGESAAAFQETYDFCEAAAFAYIHAFPYSRRPGTDAAGFRDVVPERIACERTENLSRLAEAGKAIYVQKWLGRVVWAVSEGGSIALSENYLKLRFAGGLPPRGAAFRCRILSPVNGRGADAAGEAL